ncbi:DnaT-like ssDNA-binding protein [Microbulbifer sp. VVAC002]|uniref:DnaT-like ssDNA-binding protein n=1 Tax=Microbulbifer sp. VVAC002 TaxID=3243387 RepID=UPI004039A87E
MALTIEYGTGSDSSANSYASVQDLRDYAGARGVDLSALSDAECEPLLIRAMDFLESKRDRYKGYISTQGQPLQWPRADAWGISYPDALFPSNEIPRELVYAQLALAIEARENDLQPNRLPTDTGPITKERVEGAIDVTYAAPIQQQFTPAFAKADALLAPLLKNNGLFLVRT